MYPLGGVAAMDLMTVLPLSAQTPPGAANPSSISLLALRRWCGSLTLSSPRPIPDMHGVSAFLAGLALLLVAVLIIQGPSRALRQLLDLTGHARLVRDSILRIRGASRMVAALIGLMVVSWTGAQSLAFLRDGNRDDVAQGGRNDLVQLTRSRGIGELAGEQGSLAALTPLRDVAGLADNLPLLIVAAILIFRASIEPQRAGEPASSAAGIDRGRGNPGWTTACWGVGALFILYRVVARAAGSPELPYGNCLVVDTVLIPAAMAVVDGFLLAWVLAELRNVGLDASGEGRLDPLQPLALMPAAILAVILALPSRYIAALVVLANDHLPPYVQTTALGAYIRWQLGGWGLADLQAGSFLGLGLVGVVAWTRGRPSDAIAGYGRMLATEGGHLIAILAMAGVAAGVLSAASYAAILLLPAQSWVLNAADSYAHILTLPVGLCTLAALIELARRSLPRAALVHSNAHATESRGQGLSEAHDLPSPAVAPAP